MSDGGKRQPGYGARRSKKDKRLTARQQAFVREYVVSGNAAKAATRVGYSERTAKQQGSRLLTNVDVSKAILAARKEAAERAQLTTDDLISRYQDIANADITEAVTWDGTRVRVRPSSDLSPSTRNSIASVIQRTDRHGNSSVHVKFYSKLEALARLLHYAMAREASGQPESLLQEGLLRAQAALEKKRARERGGTDD